MKTNGQKRLVLIDAFSILHRAYHALPYLTSKDGRTINAVYGFITMLLKIFEDLKPDYLAVAFDVDAPTKRQEEFIGYQAQRPKMDDELALQVEILKNFLQIVKIPSYEKAGYEADDIIGTIAKQLSQKSKIETVIVTGDRDLLQLVDEYTSIYAPIKGLTNAKLYDEKQVLEEYRLRPNQWVDYKALRGDPSDNYAGVHGIGPKTAMELLEKYQTLENIYSHLDEIAGKTAEQLKEGRKSGFLAKRLAQIVCDVDFDFDFNLVDASVDSFNWQTGIEYLKKLGFKTVVKRIEEIFIKKYKEKAREEKQLSLIYEQ